MRKAVVLTILVVLLCSPLSFASEAVKVGIVTSMSGPFAYYGTMQTQGFLLGLEYATGGTMQVLGRPIEVIIEDDTGDAGVGVQKARELVERHGVHFLQGSAMSNVALGVQAVALQNKRLFFVAPAAADSITGANWNRYTFRTASTAMQDALTGGVYAARNLAKEFVIFVPDFAWGHDTARAWRQAIEREGGVVKTEMRVPLDTQDFTSHLMRLRMHRPEAAVIAWAGAGGIRLFEQIEELGLYEEMIITSGFGEIPALIAMGDAIVGAVGMMKYYYQLPNNEVNDWLVARYMELYGTPPDLFVPDAFAAAQALVKAIEDTKSLDTETLIAYLKGMTFDTPKGPMTFRPEDHQALQAMYVIEMKKVPGFNYPVPTLIMEMSPEDTAPPITVPR